MSNFSTDLGYILSDFKKGILNYAQADLKIKQLIGQQFGLSISEEEYKWLNG